MLWLVVGLALGVAVASPGTIGLGASWSRLGPLYWHFLAVGWATQLIFGVAYWMFPPLSRERPHRSERLAWTVFALLNGGLAARFAAEAMPALLGTAPSAALFALAAFGQWLAGLAFVANTWSRVRAR